MTEVRVPWVLPEKLGAYQAQRLGDGGQGIVYGVPDPAGLFPGQTLVYKEYRKNVVYSADALYEMVCFRQRLTPGERAFLDERLTWPTVLAYRGPNPQDPVPSRNQGTEVVGFLMGRVPASYQVRIPPGNEAKPQAMQYLLNDDAYATRIGLLVDDVRRLELLLDLARTLDWLHRRQVVIGDLSPNNVLFTLQGPQGEARCLLIDCDSMRCLGRDVLDQVATPDWEVPDTEQKATPASDSWKFGLLAARIFSRSFDSTDLVPLRAVSTELANLASRAQSLDPVRRPALVEWLKPLELAHHRAGQQQAAAQAAQAFRAAQAQAQAQTQTQTGQPRAQARTGAQPPTGGSPAAVFAQSAPASAPPLRRPAPSSAGGKVVGWLLAAVLVGGVGGYAVTHMHPTGGSGSASPTTLSASPYSDPTDTPGPTDPTTDDPTPTPSPDQAVTTGATVDYSQVADDPAAEDVATMFAEFFGAINEQDYDNALKYYDPNSAAVDLGSSSSRAQWKKVMSTTRDSGFMLSALTTDGGYTMATLNFRSHQAAGYGPSGSTDDTCDDWTVTYQLTDSDGYRILKAPKGGVSYTSC
ncbi:hypothetical protein ACFXDH_05425 [Streptomyces sp. NPDC059467]|uniref:hypothetical protein n=1 Tax=Streptomyces sp. NPDC059467 TaxID=3346844 RepID=UPI0036AF51F0